MDNGLEQHADWREFKHQHPDFRGVLRAILSGGLAALTDNNLTGPT
jgi:hypothetical protein